MLFFYFFLFLFFFFLFLITSRLAKFVHIFDNLYPAVRERFENTSSLFFRRRRRIAQHTTFSQLSRQPSKRQIPFHTQQTVDRQIFRIFCNSLFHFHPIRQN